MGSDDDLWVCVRLIQDSVTNGIYHVYVHECIMVGTGVFIWNFIASCLREINYIKFYMYPISPPPSTFLNTSWYRRGNFRQNSHHIILRHWIVIFGYRWSYESAGCVDQLYTCISCVIEPADSTISKNKNSIHIFTSFWVIHCVKYSLIF